MQTWAEIAVQADDLHAILLEGRRQAAIKDIDSPARKRLRIDLEREVRNVFVLHENWLLKHLKQYHAGEFYQPEIQEAWGFIIPGGCIAPQRELIEARPAGHMFDRAFEEVAKKAVPRLAAVIYKYNRRAYRLGQNDEIEALKAGLFEEAPKDPLEIALNLRNEMAEAVMRQQAMDHATATVTRTFKDRISRNILDQAIEEGWSYDRTAKEIKGMHEYFRHGEPQKHIRSHAHMIAVAENAHAYSQGRLDTVDEVEGVLGVQFEKSWNTSGDDRVSDGCEQNENEGWIPKDQAFGSGHMREPRHPVCRCYVDYRAIDAPPPPAPPEPPKPKPPEPKKPPGPEPKPPEKDLQPDPLPQPDLGSLHDELNQLHGESVSHINLPLALKEDVRAINQGFADAVRVTGKKTRMESVEWLPPGESPGLLGRARWRQYVHSGKVVEKKMQLKSTLAQGTKGKAAAQANWKTMADRYTTNSKHNYHWAKADLQRKQTALANALEAGVKKDITAAKRALKTAELKTEKLRRLSLHPRATLGGADEVLRAVASHEYGHFVYAELPRAKQEAWRKAFNSWKRNHAIFVSDYAATSEAELFCEITAAVGIGNAQAVNPVILAAFKALLKP